MKKNKWVLTYAATSMALLALASANTVSADTTNGAAQQTTSTETSTSPVSDQTPKANDTTDEDEPTDTDQIGKGSIVDPKAENDGTDKTTGDDVQQPANGGTDTTTGNDVQQPVNDGANNTTQPVAQATAYQAPVYQAPAANTDATIQQADGNPAPTSGDNVDKDIPNASNNQLGYAAYFHIFANDAMLDAHTNGNLAVGNLSGKVNFGTNIHEGTLPVDISYIQNFSNIASSSFVYSGDYDGRLNKIIFGQDVTFGDLDTTQPTVSGIKLDHVLKDELFQDKDGQFYINIKDYLKNELSDKST